MSQVPQGELLLARNESVERIVTYSMTITHKTKHTQYLGFLTRWAFSHLSHRSLPSHTSQVLSSLPPSSHFGANEVTSRVNYYHNWCQEQIYDHTELGGSNLINAIKRGEESRAWVLNKYGCEEHLPPFDFRKYEDELLQEKEER